MTTIISSSSLSELNNQGMQNSLKDKLKMPGDTFPSYYHLNGILKYGMIYKNSYALIKIANKIRKAIRNINESKAVKMHVPNISVPDLKEGQVFFVNIKNLVQIDEKNFFEILSERDLIILNNFIEGSSDEIDFSEFDDCCPAYYKD